MNVFLPFERDKNPVLDEIEKHFNGNFIYDYYKNFDNHKIDVVNIHWPESIFNYAEPTLKQINDLEKELINWKGKAKIVFTRHNKHPHKNKSQRFIDLYNLIISYADGIIHMGNYSLKEFSENYEKFKATPSAIIYHPAYTLFKNKISKLQARKKLGLLPNKKVILVFGSVRTYEELQLIIDSFNLLEEKNKHLLISNLNIYKKLPKTFKDRILKFTNSKIEKLKFQLKKDITINYSFIENEEVQTYLNAADVLFIPRIDLLNSGNLFLGFSFKKVVVGPEIGNLTEFLQRTNNPTFNPKSSISASKALKKGLILSDKKGIENYTFVTEHCQPKDIAKSYYSFFNQLNKRI